MNDAIPPGAAETRAQPRHEGPGGHIGPYKLLQQIGEGGFGAVYEADQEHPVKRRVALKVILVGMNTRDVVARFDAERQALAMMDHPHIAHVLDAGETDGGRPYFVMELVKGEPISTYCDKHKLSIAERLELFEQVCQAVQHAHTKGVIHRDLKPSNVLVTTQEDKPCAKVIDFGIAKATSGRLTDKTLFTEQHQMIGTPLYMSPEQAEGSADIDTRTDIYSLGVLLYELLTGSTPFESSSLRAAAHVEIQRIIREVDPPAPSARLTASADTLNNVASRRNSEPRSLTRLIRGELDWIVMKAIDKERTRRYETANGLAMDVRRYLTGQPVLAAPPGQVYRFRKFVRRNQGLVGASMIVAITLLVGVVGFAWQARLAQQRAAELEQVSNFQAEMLGQVNPTQAGELLTADVQRRYAEALGTTDMPPDERAAQIAAFSREWQRLNATDAARELIDQTILAPAASAIEKQFVDQPLVAATLSQVLAERYRRIGLYDAAAPLQTRAVALRKALLGVAHPDTLSSLNALGNLLRDQGKLDEAEPIWRETLQLRRRVLGDSHADTQASVNNMGVVLYMQGRLSEVEPYFLESLQTRRRVLGSDHKDTLMSLNNMGVLLQDQGKLGEAEKYFHEALAKYRSVLGAEHASTLSSIANMGNLLEAQGKLTEAEPYFQEALEKSRRVLGAEHPDTLSSISDMGELLHDMGRFDEAEPYYREALDKRRRLLGPESPDTLSSIANMGALLVDQGQLDAGEPMALEALEKGRRIAGDDHPEILNMTISVGALRVAQGRHADAVKLLTAAEAPSRAAFSGDYAYRTAKLLTYLGKARTALGDFVTAQSNLTEAHTLFQAAPGPTARDARACVQALVQLYQAWQAAEPDADHQRQLAHWQKALPGSAEPSSALAE